MKKNEPISNIMHSDVITVDRNIKLSEARELMIKNNIHHLPVVDGKKLIGILSHNDIHRVSISGAFQEDQRQADAVMDHQLFLEDVMTKTPVTLTVNQTVRDAAKVIAENEFHSIPIVTGEELVGIVTSTDIVKYLLDQY